MSSLPQDNTARYKLFYHVGVYNHVVQVRAAGVHSPSSFGTAMDNLLTAFGTDIYQMGVDKVEFAASGSNVFNVVTSGIEGNVYGSGSVTGLLAPQFIAFQGRSSGGHRVRLSIYGIKPEENDYRFEPGDNSNVDAAIAVIQTPSAFFKAIDGVTPSWYDYANTGFNAYWQRRLR